MALIPFLPPQAPQFALKSVLPFSTWGQKPADHCQWSLPKETHIPDGLILQLWPKQGVQLGQDGDEPAARDSRVRGTERRRDPAYPADQGRT